MAKINWTQKKLLVFLVRSFIPEILLDFVKVIASEASTPLGMWLEILDRCMYWYWPHIATNGLAGLAQFISDFSSVVVQEVMTSFYHCWKTL